ncbi:MAG: hypothetical protein M3X11_00700 [Acidobacteriota bacterium]|nr:hypothetical protein [Acidobacteriota bacterium]
MLNACRAVSERAAQTLDWAVNHFNFGLLSIALDHLTLGRAALYQALLEQFAIRNPQSAIESAVSGLRRSGNLDDLPRGLLTRAWLRALTGARTGPDSAQSDLDEAWDIAARGSMKLHLADIHLYRARLFGVGQVPNLPVANAGQVGNLPHEYPWESPEADLAAAEKLINECGYHRRDEELADAKQAILLR